MCFPQRVRSEQGLFKQGQQKVTERDILKSQVVD